MALQTRAAMKTAGCRLQPLQLEVDMNSDADLTPGLSTGTRDEYTTEACCLFHIHCRVALPLSHQHSGDIQFHGHEHQ